MNKEYCEKVRISAMAISDGQQPLLQEKEITEHIKSCNDCRIAIEQLESSTSILNNAERREYDIDISQEMEQSLSSIAKQYTQRSFAYYFTGLGIALLILKIFELAPDVTTAIIVKFVSILVIVMFFIFVKQNPFAINQNILSKGDLT